MSCRRHGASNIDDAEERETPTYYPDPDEICAELQKILGEMRGATVMPWDAQRVTLYRTIFPQMAGALPEDEAAQLRFAFMSELERRRRPDAASGSRPSPPPATHP